MVDVAAIPAEPIEFIDLGAQRRRIGNRMDEAIRRVVDHGRFILGPEVGQLEQCLAEFCGAKYVLSGANGTDALGSALLSNEAGPGQAVMMPSFTFAATAEVVVCPSRARRSITSMLGHADVPRRSDPAVASVPANSEAGR